MIDSGGLIIPGNGSGPLNTGKLINIFYLEIEYLLEGIEGASNHYQTIGVERSSTSEEIIDAYQKSVSVLHPSYHKVRASVPDEMFVRIDKAFRKVSKAFAVLTDSKKRGAYEKSLATHVYSTTPLAGAEQAKEEKALADQAAKRDDDEKSAPSQGEEIKVSPKVRPLFTRASEATAERRRCERFKLSVPALVSGYEQESGKWQEIAKTINVSRIGFAVRMRRRVKHGLVVHVTLPLPTKLRSHGFSEPGYNMYAIVRRVEPVSDGLRIVGLEFLGANPPAGYLHKPWTTFRTQKWSGPDRRREPRRELAESVAVEYLDESMQRIAREAAVTEDVSPSGARVRVKSAPREFEFVRITCPARGFISVALLRNQFTGSDGFERLCLQFVDQKWPV